MGQTSLSVLFPRALTRMRDSIVVTILKWCPLVGVDVEKCEYLDWKSNSSLDSSHVIFISQPAEISRLCRQPKKAIHTLCRFHRIRNCSTVDTAPAARLAKGVRRSRMPDFSALSQWLSNRQSEVGTQGADGVEWLAQKGMVG